MSDTLDYIDDYFTGVLSESERREFEARCSNDEAFAADVAFYVTARHHVKDVLLEQKNQQWKEENAGASVVSMKVQKKKSVLRWMSSAVAACLVFIIASYFLFYRPTPERLAEQYITKNKLSLLMDAGHDSLQAGIAEYKTGKYENAVRIFNDIRKREADNSEAQEYAGHTYLTMKEYDKALECFQKLSAINGLEINSGDMMQAVTLLERDKPGDERAAKVLLEKVVREDENGSEDAKEILDVW